MSADDRASARGRAVRFLDSSALASAFTLTSIGALLGAHLLTSMIGVPGYGAIIVGLCALAVAILAARRRELSVVRFMPLTLLAFLGWLLATVIWSTSPRLTISGWLTLAAVTLLAITVTHIRDTLQTVRATGDALRVFLVGSLAVEVFSGILIDLPIPFLGISGNLAEGGPIQGLFGTRTRLGLVTVIALITFLVEWRTRSVRPGVALFSVTLASLLAVFTASPIVLVLAVIAGAATGVLVIVRRVPERMRSAVQLSIAAAVAVATVLIYAFRRPIVYWLNAEPDFLTRSRLWNAVLDMAELRPVQGWGWFGQWAPDYLPFNVIIARVGRSHASALNGYFDVLLQAGWVGLALFLVFCGLALMRAWITASERKSTVYNWPALILIVLLANAVVDSTILTGFGWFLLVFCATRSSLTRGWRAGIADRADRADLPHQSGDRSAPDSS